VVITGSAADGPELAKHARSKQARHDLKERAKDPKDELELVDAGRALLPALEQITR
jgi:type I restriction enzyme, R subunit